jgi:hypothetical protein
MGKNLVALKLSLILMSAIPIYTAGVSRHLTAFQSYSFSLTQTPENPMKYSLVISDDDEHSISGIFSIEQLQVLKAIMTEAEKFALNEEAVGTTESTTTRFADKQEASFVIDVEKLGTQSGLFLTVKSEVGRMTVNAGKISRSNRREEGFFFDLLSRLESVLPKLPVKPSK